MRDRQLLKRAFTKINLGLRVLDKRADGYHNIETIFHRVLPYDEIDFERSTKISLTTKQPNLPTDERNLSVRAAKLLQKNFGVVDGIKIELTKRIPIGAGLGGGSSDAATTLRALIDLWELNVPEATLKTLALELGSDVPYFLREGTAYATGRGEQLNYFKLDLPYWILVVYPNVQVSTAWAYQHVKTNPHKSDQGLKDILLKNIADLEVLRDRLHNDFEPSVFAAHPEIAQLKQTMYDCGAGFAQLSGSGSSVYGLFDNESAARNTIAQVETKYPVFLTPPHFQPGESKFE